MDTRITTPETTDLERFAASASRFLSAPASPKPLAALRIGLSTVLLAQGLALGANLLDLYGSHGVVQWAVTDSAVGTAVPKLRWAVDAFAHLGVGESAVIRGVFALYMGSLGALLLGYRTRVAAIVVWITHLMMDSSAMVTVYGVDTFANIALFYCTWMPIGCAWSADKAAGRTSDAPTAFARLSLRVLQVHLCIVYFASGIEKAMGADWWNGEAIWDSMMRRDLCPWDISWMAKVPFIPTIIGLGTLVLEVGYAVFVWPRMTRRLWAGATISMHVGIAIFLGLVSFAALMSVMTFAAFMVNSEPEVVGAAETSEKNSAPQLAEMPS